MNWIKENSAALVLIAAWIGTVVFINNLVNQSETRVRGDMAELRADIREFKAEVKTDFVELRERVDTVIETHGERITKLENRQ